MPTLLPRSNLHLRVMADHASSGIWVIGGAPPPWRHGMVDHAALGLSEELSTRFAAWITLYEEQELDGKLDIDSFNREGLELAKSLKQVMGPDVYVEYEPEWSKEPRPAPIVIR